jgi:hypothetical protein
LLDEATHHIIDRSAADAAAMATSYLRLFGVVVAAYLLARQAAIASARLDAGEGSEPFLRAKIGTAAFFADEILPEATARHSSIMNASAAKLFALSEEQLSA